MLKDLEVSLWWSLWSIDFFLCVLRNFFGWFSGNFESTDQRKIFFKHQLWSIVWLEVLLSHRIFGSLTNKYLMSRIIEAKLMRSKKLKESFRCNLSLTTQIKTFNKQINKSPPSTQHNINKKVTNRSQSDYIITILKYLFENFSRKIQLILKEKSFFLSLILHFLLFINLFSHFRKLINRKTRKSCKDLKNSFNWPTLFLSMLWGSEKIEELMDRSVRRTL